MSYPDYPKNRLIVNGVDLTEKFKMVLADGYELKPPEPKKYTVDIPGGNGVIDLTEILLGDVAYNNREQVFNFYAIYTEEFERVKTKVSNFLHGKAFDYEMTMDPDYIYHGRFKVDSYSHNAYMHGIVGVITVSVDADPYKRRKPYNVYVPYSVNGVIMHLECGRLSTNPVIKNEVECYISFKGYEYTLEPGTWTLDDIVFEDGLNEVFVSTNIDYRTVYWKYFSANKKTFKDVRSKRIFEWYKYGKKYNNIENRSTTWSRFYIENTSWDDIRQKPIYLWYRYATYKQEYNTEGESQVTITYEWSDL